MVSNKDYILLCDVLNKMDANSNYKATYPEQTAIYSVLGAIGKNTIQTGDVDIKFLFTVPNLLLLE